MFSPLLQLFEPISRSHPNHTLLLIVRSSTLDVCAEAKHVARTASALQASTIQPQRIKDAETEEHDATENEDAAMRAKKESIRQAQTRFLEAKKAAKAEHVREKAAILARFWNAKAEDEAAALLRFSQAETQAEARYLREKAAAEGQYVRDKASEEAQCMHDSAE